jgi:hypothetical protein
MKTVGDTSKPASLTYGTAGTAAVRRWRGERYHGYGYRLIVLEHAGLVHKGTLRNLAVSPQLYLPLDLSHTEARL